MSEATNPTPEPPTTYDAIVVGAGISGLVAASMVLQQGSRSVLVVDEYDHVGGNHIDVSIGNYTFDVGSFIFQDDSPLMRHFPELLPHYVAIEPSWARLNPQGHVTAYPFSLQDDLLAAGPVEILRIIASAVRGRLHRRPMQNAHDFAKHWVGARFLYRSGLESYMARFCGCPIDQIDLAFAESRMLWLSDHARLVSILRRVRDKLWGGSNSLQPKNTQLARPQQGFSALYQPAVRRLQERGVTFLLGRGIQSVTPSDDAYVVCVGGRSYTAARVISTIPIALISKICGHPLEHPLPSVTLVSLFYSFVGERGFMESILYNFSHKASWKRLTMYSDFYGEVEGRCYFAVEVVAPEGQLSAETAAEEFRRHTAENGLLDGALTLEGSHVLEQAYPIYVAGSALRAAKAVEVVRDLGIESFGRQGAFRYQPTARVSTLEAEAALRRR